MEARILNNNEIDKDRWNQLVQSSTDIQIYNNSNYLDALCPNWQAIIVGDYEACLALPFKKKFGFKIYANPPFLQKLNVLGKQSKPNLALIEDAIKKLKLVRLGINNNYFGDIRCLQRQNYIIDLSNSYESIKASYKTNAIRNIKKAHTYNLKVIQNVDYNITIKHFLDSYRHLNNYKDEHVLALKKYLNNHQSKFECYGVMLNDELLIYSVIILKDTNRLYYLISGAQKDYKKYKPTYFFIDWFLKEKSNSKNIIFDFEGSDIATIAYYYKSYGAINEGYYQYEANNYTFPIKQIMNKKLKL